MNTLYQTISRGTTAKNVADGIFDVALAIASLTKYVGFLTTGISLYDAFANMFGISWATGATDDSVQVRLIYDNTDQWTSRNINGEWYIGLVTQKVVISNIASEQYYWNSVNRQGHTYPKNRNVSVTHKSSNFDSPWAVAYQWCYNPVTEYMHWQRGGVLFYF